MPHRVAYIDASAWHHNISLIKRCYPDQRIMLPIKANAYGHQLSLMVATVDDLIDAYWVATVDEANTLRVATKKRIAVAQYDATIETAMHLASLNCDLVIHDLHQIKMLRHTMASFDRIWLKINTGMNRLGVLVADYYEAMALLNQYCPSTHIAIMTHLADAKMTAANMAQLESFKSISVFHDHVSWANSAGLSHPDWLSLGNWIRPGLLSHGVNPDGVFPMVKPVLSLYAQILQYYDLKAGDCVGYDRTWVATQPTRMAVVSMGYADGLPQYGRSWHVVVNGQRCPVIGKVSMDLCSIDVSSVPKVSIGDWVELVGPSQSLLELCDAMKVSPYVFVSGLGPRVSFLCHEELPIKMEDLE